MCCWPQHHVALHHALLGNTSKKSFGPVRKTLLTYTHGLPSARRLRAALSSCASSRDAQEVVAQYSSRLGEAENMDMEEVVSALDLCDKTLQKDPVKWEYDSKPI